MTTITREKAVEISTQLAQIQAAAARLMAQLCDRSAYVSDDEFKEILNLVRALRQFCGMSV